MSRLPIRLLRGTIAAVTISLGQVLPAVANPVVLSSEAQPLLSSPQDARSPSIPKQVVTDTLRLEVNLSRRQLTVYEGETVIQQYPIAVGRPGWETPTGHFEVKQMRRNPIWINPLTGQRINGGDPQNPLGRYWIGFWTDGNNWVGFHGTPNPETVGQVVSHGCIRMYNEDIKDLFQIVRVGTPVSVVN